MLTFRALRTLRASQKTLLPAIQTGADLDIVLEVGAAQESHRVLGIQTLIEANLGPPATIARRLDRLKRLGLIEQRIVPHDKRRRHIQLHAPVYQTMITLARKIRRVR